MKSVVYNYLFFLFLVFTIGCNKKPSKSYVLTKDVGIKITNIDTASYFSKNEIQEFKKNVIYRGDALSFSKLVIQLGDESNYKELQKYALIMADEYNNGNSCCQVFINIVALNNNNVYNDIYDFAKINEQAKLEALKYLEKGILLDEIGCISMLRDIYRNGIGTPVNKGKADKLQKMIDQSLKLSPSPRNNGYAE